MRTFTSRAKSFETGRLRALVLAVRALVPAGETCKIVVLRRRKWHRKGGPKRIQSIGCAPRSPEQPQAFRRALEAARRL